MAERDPLGILGGTFDPVHFGHLRLAEEALEGLGLRAVLWIPAGHPPHRAPPRTPARHRLEMVQRAITGNPRFALDESEARSEGPSFTVPTLERLRTVQGTQRPLVLVLGADAFLGLASWHRWMDLFNLAHVAIASRPSFQICAQRLDPRLAGEFEARRRDSTAALREMPAGAIMPFEITPLAISASSVRALLAAGRSARYLLPDRVLDYIGLNRLYSTDPHGNQEAAEARGRRP